MAVPILQVLHCVLVISNVCIAAHPPSVNFNFIIHKKSPYPRDVLEYMGMILLHVKDNPHKKETR